MSKLKRLLQRGLERTAHLWPEIRTAYSFVRQAAHLLANHDDADVFELRHAYRGLLAEIGEHREAEGFLGEAVRIFRKVTKSYWSGLFACYQMPDLPRTNNDLEHLFGSARYQERRITGRKLASPALVVRGSVRLVTAVASRLQVFSASELRPHDLVAWRTLRHDLDDRQEARRAQLRFRRDHDAYLAQLEDQLLKSALPP